MKKSKKTDVPTERRAISATFDGLGVLGGLSLGGVVNSTVKKCMKEVNVALTEEEQSKVTDIMLSMLLDMKVHGSCPEGWKEKVAAAGGFLEPPVGLWKALDEKIDVLAQEWSITIEKLMDVMWLSFRDAYRVLEQDPESVEAKALRVALGQIFRDGKDQRALEHFLAQTASLLNDWSFSKPRCPGCLDKNAHCELYGISEDFDSARIVCIKLSDPPNVFVPEEWLKMHLQDKFHDKAVYIGRGRPPRPNKKLKGEDFVQFDDFMSDKDPVVEKKMSFQGARELSNKDWQPLLSGCKEGDVLLIHLDENQQLVQSVDFYKATKIWSSTSQSKLAHSETGWIPKNSVDLCFPPCTCRLWNLDWKPFTEIVTKAIRDVTNVLPEKDTLLKFLKSETQNISEKAKRLHEFIKGDLTSGGSRLSTTLTPSFLDANVAELQVALNNLMDTEQGGADLRSWTRVFSALASVEKIGDYDVLMCQTLNRKALKAIVRDVIDPFIITGKSSAGFGLMWRFPFDYNVGAGIEACEYGWKTVGSDADTSNAPAPPDNLGLTEIGNAISRGEVLSFAPTVFLRGFEESPKSYNDLCSLDCSVLFMSTSSPKELFEKSLGGSLTRQLIASVLKKLKGRLLIVVAPEAWILWWKNFLLGQGEDDAAKKKKTKKQPKKQRRVVELSIGPLDGEDGVLPSGQVLLSGTEVQQAAGILKWYNFVLSLQKEKKQKDDKEEEEKEEDIVKKKHKQSFCEFFHKTCGPFYAMSISDEALSAAERGGAAVPPVALSKEDHERLTKPMDWQQMQSVPAGMHVYGKGEGVIVSHVYVDDYERALDQFLSNEDDFFSATLEKLGRCRDVASICAVFFLLSMPFTLARLPLTLATDLVHLFLGQDYKDGWTFANQEKGSSVPVRFVHRRSGLSDNQFATFDVSPCNHDWKHDLDYFVACAACRPALCESKEYDKLKHIDPKLPEEPKNCVECKRRWTRLMDWLCVMLAAMIVAVALSGAKMFVTPAGSVARAVWNRLCRNAPEWLRQLKRDKKLKQPSCDVSHSNAVSFAKTESRIRTFRAELGTVAIELRNFRTGESSKRWPGGLPQFYAELQSVYEPFNPSVLNAKRMTAAKAARDVLTPLVECEVRNVNKLVGKGDCLDPIDMRFRLTRLLAQVHLEKLAVSKELASKIVAIVSKASKEKAATTATAPAARPAVAPNFTLTRNDKRAFAAHCNSHLLARLRDPKVVRTPLLRRLGLETRVLDPAEDVVNGRGLGWRESVAKCFEHTVLSLFGSWRNRMDDLKILVAHGEEAMLDCFCSSGNDEQHQFFLDCAKVEALLKKKPPETKRAKGKTKDEKKSKTPAPKGYLFVPKLPQVKIVFKTKLPIGMFLISRTVASEIIVDASRRVLQPSNLTLMGLDNDVSRSNVPKAVICGALLAAFDRQREYFAGGVEGQRANFIVGLKRMLAHQGEDGPYRLQSHVACADKHISKAFLLSLFDYRRVFPKSQYGKVCARTDGRSLNLTGLLPKTAKKSKQQSDEEVLEERRAGFRVLVKKLHQEAEEKLEKLEAAATSDSADERLQSDLANARQELQDVEVLFIGLDCGKSGLNGVMAPSIIRKAVMKKAEAEAELANAQASKDASAIATAAAKVKNATLSEEAARLLFEQAQVPTSSTSRPDEHPMRKNRSEKGAHSITKGTRKSEMLESKLRKIREERLAIFDECFIEGFDHHSLEKLFLIKLSSVVFDAATDRQAIASRLLVYRLLKIAYNSGDQRKERRTTAIKSRGFTARATRLLTKDLPEAVLRSPDKFLEKSLPFPKRSPQSRQRDKVRGWERGVNRAMSVIESSNSTCRLPVWIAADMFSGKGQRISSTFPFQELYRSMLRHIQSRPKLAERVMVYIDNGYRSSRQAAGTMCYLANLERADHRKVQALDLPGDWLGKVLDGFGYFYCPVTKTLVKRDPPASMSMSTIGTCTFYSAPHPSIWAPAHAAAE